MLSIIGLILTLVVMEGLLSADNALVLAVMTGKLPKDQQKKALFYGMWGAIGFRALCIALWAFISGWSLIWVIKVVGALYLGYLSFKHFSGKGQEDNDNDGVADEYESTWFHRLLSKFGIRLSTFWTVVISVEIMDVAFSVDSILAAFALSQNFWVLLFGGLLGILMMRSVASIFQKLIEKIPEMESTAFVLIGIIALKMLLSTVHNIVALFGTHIEEIEVPDGFFFGILVLTFALTFVVHLINKKKTATV